MGSRMMLRRRSFGFCSAFKTAARPHLAMRSVLKDGVGYPHRCHMFFRMAPAEAKRRKHEQRSSTRKTMAS